MKHISPTKIQTDYREVKIQTMFPGSDQGRLPGMVRRRVKLEVMYPALV